MKLKFLLIAAISLCSSHWIAADEPTLEVFSYGWFSSSGYYPIEYWVDAYDNDGDMNWLYVSAHDEAYDEWYNTTGTGDGSHRQAHGWGTTLDGYTDGRVWVRDSVDTYYHDVEFSF